MLDNNDLLLYSYKLAQIFMVFEAVFDVQNDQFDPDMSTLGE